MCPRTHCTLAKIALQKMSGHSSHTQLSSSQYHAHSHTHRNFGNDDMYSTFVHSLETNNVGSCNFNISLVSNTVGATLKCP